MFAGVKVFPAMAGGNIVQWTLVPGVPAGFTVEVYRDASGEWSKIGEVKDTYFFIDSSFDTSCGFSTVYRLVLNRVETYTVTSFVGALPDKDRNYIKAIRRREMLLQDKGGGRPGFLLKRRSISICPSCNNNAGGGSCPVCSGSGYSGGFYKAVPYGMLTVNPQLKTTKTTSPIGVFSPNKEVTRGLVYPFLDEGDVWVEKFTDRRFFITGKTELTYRGVPIIYTQVELSLVPSGSPVYEVQL